MLVQLKANHPSRPEAMRSYGTEHPPDERHYRGDWGKRSRREQRTVPLGHRPAGIGS